MYLVHICTKYIMYLSTYYVLVHNYVVMPPFVLFCAIFFCSVFAGTVNKSFINGASGGCRGDIA